MNWVILRKSKPDKLKIKENKLTYSINIWKEQKDIFKIKINRKN